MNISSNRKFIVAALTFFLVLSIGYAVFSETITIEGTATAQMEGGVEFECASGIISDTGLDSDTLYTEWSDGNTKIPKREEGYGETSCIIEGSSISVSANLKYPRASKAYTIKMTNNASYPVMIDQTKMSFSGYDGNPEMTNYGMTFCKTYIDDASTCMQFNYADGNGYNGVSQIDPGKTHYITIILFWNGEDKYNDGVARNNKFTLNVPYAQVQ